MPLITQGKTNWKFLLIVIILAIIVGGVTLWYLNQSESSHQPVGIEQPEKITLDSKNCTYILDDKNIALKNGYSEDSIYPGSSSKNITQYFGNEVSGDFNKDGLSDAAFILSQKQSGSGFFYYIAVALGNSRGCKGTNAVFLGDRIAPQTINIDDENRIVVNYTERKKGESTTTPPSIGVTKRFVVEGTTLKDIDKEQACITSGGTIQTMTCCTGISDFINSCEIGACGCSSIFSHQMKICNCGTNRCFNGETCVNKASTPQEVINEWFASLTKGETDKVFTTLMVDIDGKMYSSDECKIAFINAFFLRNYKVNIKGEPIIGNCEESTALKALANIYGFQIPKGECTEIPLSYSTINPWDGTEMGKTDTFMTLFKVNGEWKVMMSCKPLLSNK
jgi:hypothetical protein